MKQLNEFLVRVKAYGRTHVIDDVLDLLPLFDQFQLSGWSRLFACENGEPAANVLYQSQFVKLVLIYWKGGQASSVHGHRGGGGLIRVLSGRLEETRYAPDDTAQMIDRAVLETGDLSYIHDVLAYHRVHNPEDAPAASLHLYSTHVKKSA